MVRSPIHPPPSAEAPDSTADALELVFVELWTTGPDPAADGLVKLEALRRGSSGELERFERWTDPFADGRDGALVERSLRAQGIESRELAGSARADAAWRELASFAGARKVVALEAAAFQAWAVHFAGRPWACVLGCDEFREQWLPGRARGAPPGSRGADAVRAHLGELVARVLEQDPAVLRFAHAVALCALRALRETDSEELPKLELALELLRRPSLLAGEGGAAGDGELDEALGESGREDPAAAARAAIEALEPAWARGAEAAHATVPITAEGELPFEERDLALVDEVFQAQLPAIAGEHGEQLRYRAGQHAVARDVARTLGARELLLVHAPTGTGKTLAYLVPAMIWAARHGVRIGVVTYTRALQEQAMDREVPRALCALERAAGLSPHRLPCTPRIALLKGRANYVCWRALKLHAPGDEESGEAWLAWLTLALFSLRDDTGDLDRLPSRAPGSRQGRERAQREWDSLTRQVRNQVRCCQQREDRATCGAEVARQRAERAHVVIANHAFALVRQAYFKHVVFDECEHLHEQAHAAWSHATSTEELRQLLARIGPGGKATSRAPLDRLERTAFPGTESAEALERAAEASRGAAAAIGELDGELERFVEWRAERERARDVRDHHSLLREFVLHGDSAGLIAARTRLAEALGVLAGEMARLAEGLDALAMRGVARLRRQIELLRVELDELAAHLEAWMPIEEGAVAYHEHTFYDVEQNPRGQLLLTARVLLPNEYLGRHYLPELSNAVLVSATTWLRGGFDSAKAYLGLDRAEKPAEGELREPCSVRCVRAPDPFDYARVLVSLPSDAPSYAEQRAAWSAYVRRFIAHLGERTRGRMLVLFTNQEELKRFGEELSGFFSARRIPFWYQGMRGVAKEELATLFRRRVDSILMGVDTFWYGADFPGETLEYLVIAKLPYGVPDRYHHAQCAALGSGEQRRRIYLPRALAKFRQGFGRLMRRETDRGCVFLLDPRAREAKHRLFLGELPLAGGVNPDGAWQSGGAHVARGTTDDCLRAAFAHMDLAEDVRRRGLDTPFAEVATRGDAVDPDQIPF